MTAPTLTRYFTDDHVRLDELLARFLRLKNQEPAAARAALEQFKAGLEQHMAWEEAILFSEYDARVPSVDEESPTVELNFEHQQIRDVLERLIDNSSKAAAQADSDVALLSRLLLEHNESEERGLYLKLDGLLSADERAQILQQMRDSALPS